MVPRKLCTREKQTIPFEYSQFIHDLGFCKHARIDRSIGLQRFERFWVLRRWSKNLKKRAPKLTRKQKKRNERFKLRDQLHRSQSLCRNRRKKITATTMAAPMQISFVDDECFVVLVVALKRKFFFTNGKPTEFGLVGALFSCLLNTNPKIIFGFWYLEMSFFMKKIFPARIYRSQTF